MADRLRPADAAWAARGSRPDEFRQERTRATEDFRQKIMTGYHPRPGFTKVRQDTIHPIVGGFDVSDPRFPPPNHARLSACLKSGGLILDDPVREMVAHLAIALVLSQINSSEGRPIDLGDTKHHRDAADAAFARCQFQLDLDGDGEADALYGHRAEDVIYLRRAVN